MDKSPSQGRHGLRKFAPVLKAAGIALLIVDGLLLARVGMLYVAEGSEGAVGWLEHIAREGADNPVADFAWYTALLAIVGILACLTARRWSTDHSAPDPSSIRHTVSATR